MRSTRWWPSLQSYRETQSAQRKTQQKGKHRRNLDAVQLGGRQLLLEYHPWRGFFLGTDWYVVSTAFMTDS